MVVFSNQRLGPSAELLVSEPVAATMLRNTAEAARPFAQARWERELISWLEERAAIAIASATMTRGSEATRDPSASNPRGTIGITAVDVQFLDIGDIAWTPDHFEVQRRFLIEAILRASATCEHTLALDRWRRQIEAHPADSVQVGRRWIWQPTA